MMTTLTAADGHVLDCWIEPAQGTRRGGVVILQEIFGVTDQLKGVARRYAAEGYEVAVPALFDRGEKGAVIPFDDAARGRDLMTATKIEETTEDIGAAVAALAAKGGKVAVLGFCWGGGLVFRAAQKLPVACGVAFYGTRLPTYSGLPLKAPVLGHFGLKDDHTPPDMIAAAQKEWPELELHLYEAGHAFANDARPAHVPDAAELAHARTIEFLRKHVG